MCATYVSIACTDVESHPISLTMCAQISSRRFILSSCVVSTCCRVCDTRLAGAVRNVRTVAGGLVCKETAVGIFYTSSDRSLYRCRRLRCAYLHQFV